MRLRHSQRGPAIWWALAFTTFTLGVQWLPGIPQSWPFDRSVYGAGAWWQLLTAQWVHWTSLHAAVNVLGFTVLLLAFQQLVAGRLQAVALLGGYAGVALVVAFDANCAHYAGASGALHGLLAGSAVALLLPSVTTPHTVVAPHVRTQWLGGWVLLGLAIKLWVQHGVANPSIPGWLGFATYYPAHEAGAVGGLIAVLLARGFQLGYRAAGPSSRP
ncbi:MAG: rhomboid family intramembrane serine protease [Rhodoferax sp.]